LYSNTQARMNTLIGTSIGSATLTYEVIGVLGYLTFGSRVGANIIQMYPASSLFIAVGQLAIVVLVLVSYPLQVHPCRNCLDKVFHFGNTYQSVPAGDEDTVAEVEDDVHGPHADMSKARHTALTAAIIVSGFLIAYFVDDLRLGMWRFFLYPSGLVSRMLMKDVPVR
jgi:amino acid permease